MVIRRSRLFPAPFHSALLYLVWLILHDFSSGHIVLGLFVALLIPFISAPLNDEMTLKLRPLKALKYLMVLIWDIIVSNLEVAKKVLQSNKHLKPGFIAYPLEVTDPRVITALTSSISLTPGTVSVELSEGHRWLYIHTLDLDDEAALIAHIKRRYEYPLKEVFQC